MATRFVTVSVEIMRDTKLNQSQKFLMAEIEQLTTLEKGCIASNLHFSNLIGITKENVSRNINDLVKKGYIYIEIVAGSRNHTRIITLTTLVRPPYQSSKTPLLKQQETKENKTINKVDSFYINLRNTEKDLFPVQYIRDFYEYRKLIKKPIKTIGPLKAYNKELIKLATIGYKTSEIDEFIQQMKNSEWQTIKVEYVHKVDFKGPRLEEVVI